MTTKLATTPEDEFIPGSVTDTCGVCFERFDLQYPADQYSTVRNWGTDTFDLVCPDCDDAIAAEDATMTEYTANLAALDEHLIPTGAHWTAEGPRGGGMWVIRWNREAGTVQARRFEHGSSDGFSAEAGSLPAARREALRIAKLINDGKTRED